MILLLQTNNYAILLLGFIINSQLNRLFITIENTYARTGYVEQEYYFHKK